SSVLPDGRVVVIGGEYNSNGQTWTNMGFLYDPTTNAWSAQLTEPFGTGNVGDTQSVVLQNGTMLIADISNSNLASFNPSTLTFTALNPTGKNDRNDEEGWSILPDGRVLTADAATANISEIYDPVANTWGSNANTQVALSDLGGNCNSQEVGPAVQRADGTIINFTGNPAGRNAVYSIGSNTWSNTAAMNFPVISGAQYGAADAPASLLPDGNVLVMSSPVTCHQTKPGPPPVYSIFNKPVHFFEWDGANLTQVADSPNASSLISYQGSMLLLPSGEVLLMAYDQASTDEVQLYSSGGAPQDAWRPVIDTAPSVVGPGDSYAISGAQFNGFSQGAAYGDDYQMATNYPLVRITNTGSGHVVYARTHDHSRMGIESVGSAEIVTTTFDAPSTLELGASTLVVVTNGIPSLPFDINVEPATSLAFTGSSATTAEFDDPATVQALLASGGNPVANKPVTFAIDGSLACSASTDASGVATCQVIPTQTPGPHTLTANFASDSSFAGSSASTAFTITKEESAIAFTIASAVTGDFDDPATLQAQLSTDGGTTPIAARMVTFALGALTCSAVTDAGGIAACQITPDQPAGPQPLSVTFASDAFYTASAASGTFTVTKEETTLAFTVSSPTVIANANPATFSATLNEDGITPILGRSVIIALGAQSCTGTTDATGTASCTIVVNQPLGPGTVSASFTGDAFYLPSANSEAVIVFAFLDTGSMALGDLSDGTGNPVEFWGAQWARNNALSGGPAPNAFKGFADTAPHSCGTGWTSGPGNSPHPPASVPSYMGVVVSSTIVQGGNNIRGDVPAIVVVRTNPGYGPSPGHAGTGTVVAVFCGH
ncbi:MAG: Ig-like domain repeat protein, partial [Lysobacterales bacterium]